ncbi:hypothetical protein D3C78_1574500 [compost metagenome]
MALVIADQAVMQGLVGGLLQCGGHGGGDAEAFGVGVAAIAADHFGAGHFGDVGRIQFRRLHMVARVHRFGDGGVIAGLVDGAQFQHAAEDPVAALHAALWVDQWVVARGGLG